MFVPRFGLRLNLSYTDTDLQQHCRRIRHEPAPARSHRSSGTRPVISTIGDERSRTRPGPDPSSSRPSGARAWRDFDNGRIRAAALPGSATRLTATSRAGSPSCVAGTCTATTTNPPGGTGTGNIPGRSNFFLSNENGPTLLAGVRRARELRANPPVLAIRIEGGRPARGKHRFIAPIRPRRTFPRPRRATMHGWAS